MIKMNQAVFVVILFKDLFPVIVSIKKKNPSFLKKINAVYNSFF